MSILICDSQYAGIIQSDIGQLRHEVMMMQTRVCNHLVLPPERKQFLWSLNILNEAWIVFQLLSMQGSIFAVREGGHTTYSVAFRLQVLSKVRALCINLRMQKSSLLSMDLSFVGRGLRVCNIVPEESEIMTACKTGDSFKVWKLLNSRSASVHDVTPTNASPLLVSTLMIFTK